MRVCSSTLNKFQQRLLTNDLFDDLASNYPKVVGRSVSASEANACRASLPRLEAILRLAALPLDSWITVEERVPYFAKRIDVALFGYDGHGRPNMVIVELKAWTEAVALDNGNVQTHMAGSLVSEPHPSSQVRGYHDHLLDFCRAFHSNAPILSSSGTYCHNYPGHSPDAGLFHPQFDEIRLSSPTFGAHDARQFAKYLQSRLSGGKGESVLRRYDQEGIGPSKQLIAHASEMIQRQQVFRLLDDELAANNAIMRALRTATKQRQKKTVILVRGGAGTGKSIIALNALGETL